MKKYSHTRAALHTYDYCHNKCIAPPKKCYDCCRCCWWWWWQNSNWNCRAIGLVSSYDYYYYYHFAMAFDGFCRWNHFSNTTININIYIFYATKNLCRKSFSCHTRVWLIFFQTTFPIGFGSLSITFAAYRNVIKLPKNWITRYLEENIINIYCIHMSV